MKRIAFVLSALWLGGCATAPPPPVKIVANTYCKIVRPLKWSVADTTQTIEGIRAHNAERKSNCKR